MFPEEISRNRFHFMLEICGCNNNNRKDIAHSEAQLFLGREHDVFVCVLSFQNLARRGPKAYVLLFNEN